MDYFTNSMPSRQAIARVALDLQGADRHSGDGAWLNMKTAAGKATKTLKT